MKPASIPMVLVSLVVMDAVFAPLLRALISAPSDLAYRAFVVAMVIVVLVNVLMISLAVRKLATKSQ